MKYFNYLVFFLGSYLFTSYSLANNYSTSALRQLTLEELMELDVTIATKKEKKLSSIAAPVFIISADDIHHSGANNVPEALRMAPGVQVSQIGPHDWSVAIRGFNDLFSNKLLVLVNGRAIYSSFLAGTFWRDIQSMAMEDIKQIEIIRGSGGNIWGANAVNGVINIITYSALESEGGKIIVGGGSEQRAFVRTAYTKKITDQLGIKTYANYFKVDDSKGLAKSNNKDGGDGWRTGAQFDFDNETDQFSIDADWYEHYLKYNSLNTLLTPPFSEIRNTRSNFRGGHILAKWSHQVSKNNQWSLQTYFDHTKRNDQILQVQENIWDVDFNHQFEWADQHTITWGAGYRHSKDKATNSLTFAIDPAERDLDIYNLFAQDEIALDTEKNWLFTFGSKFEYYTLSKWEVQPSVSLLWQVNEDHGLWASASHAVRTPSRNQHDIQAFLFEQLVAPNTPLFVQGSGKKGLDAENMTAYQFGWRGKFARNITTDVSFFYHDYKDLTRIEMTGAIFIDSKSFAILPGQVNNILDAKSYGAEIAINWQPTDKWRNHFSYSYFKLNSQPQAGHTLSSPNSDERTAPQQMASLRSHILITQAMDFNIWFRYTDETLTGGRKINDYFNLDLRLGWQMHKQLELSVVGQNLIQTNHLEFDQGLLYAVESQVERGVYGKLAWRF